MNLEYDECGAAAAVSMAWRDAASGPGQPPRAGVVVEALVTDLQDSARLTRSQRGCAAGGQWPFGPPAGRGVEHGASAAGTNTAADADHAVMLSLSATPPTS